jgi:hypothetical protein
MTKHDASDTLDSRDRPAIILTEAMVDAGAERFADIEGTSPAYQAKEVFLAMAKAGQLTILAQGKVCL